MDNRGLDGHGTSVLIDDILNDKELFWKYILGGQCQYCNACNLKELKDSKDIHQIQEEALNKKEMSIRDQRIAQLKAKMQGIKAQDNLLSASEKQDDLKCADEFCFNKEYMNVQKVEEKYNKIIADLKVNIDLWKKKKYNIFGNNDTSGCYLIFEKDGQIIKYSNKTEQFEKNCVIGAVELVLFAEFVKLTNEEVPKWCK